jgi:hypothetical protein
VAETSRQTVRRRRVRRRVHYVVALAAMLLVLQPAAGGALPNQYRQVPSLWAPTDTVTLLDNGAAWGDVNYWWKWRGPSSTLSEIYNSGYRGVLELGWKSTGKSGCRQRDGALGRGGFPADMNIQNDHFEDPDDAVIWMADLDLLRADNRLNPNKEYSAWWNCGLWNGADDYFRGDTDRPYLESSNARWNTVESPNTTLTAGVLHNVPAEQGYRGVPPSTNRGQAVQTNSHLPWDANLIGNPPIPGHPNWNFENSDTSMWTTTNATKTRYVGNAQEGGAYLYLQPSLSTQGILNQNFKVNNYSIRDGQSWQQFELGSATGYQFSGHFRCPTWSPAYFNKNTNYCHITVSIKTARDTWTNKSFAFDIPNDGNWHFWLSNAWLAQLSDDDINLRINNNGYPIDLDAIWVSSGI